MSCVKCISCFTLVKSYVWYMLCYTPTTASCYATTLVWQMKGKVKHRKYVFLIRSQRYCYIIVFLIENVFE